MPRRADRPARKRAAPKADPLPFDLLGRMSHELRTPLNAILGFSELMAVGTFGPLLNARYQEYVKLIHRSAANLLATIDGLQRLIRMRAGGIALRAAPIDLDQAAHAALEAVSGDAAKRRIMLRREKAKRPVVVAGDRELIAELLTELVRNAVNFTPEGGRVVVRVDRGPQGARVQVIDSGVGVGRSVRDHVFEPFVQLKPAGVPSHEGPGLGLAIVAAITARHGGRVALAAAPGGGTKATLILPLPAAPPVRSRSSAAKPAPSGRRSRSRA